MALLQRGTCHCGEFDKVEEQGVLLLMEYASSVGTMVVDEVAHVNKRMLRAVVEMRESVNLVNTNYGSLEVCFNKEVQKWRAAERQVDVLKDDSQNLRDEVQNLRGLFNDVLFRLADVEAEVRELCLFRVISQHSPGNPIIVEDNNETVANSKDEQQWLAAEESDEKVEIVEEGEVRGGMVFPTGGLLVLIVDEEEEDPRDPSRQVDWAEEREELMRHQLTMDDVAFQEAMETEQAACIDSVPGYEPAPLYSECSE